MINTNIRKEGLYLGHYDTQYDVWNIYPNPLNGSFMTVGQTLSVWLFIDGRWRDTARSGGGSADTTEIEAAIKEIEVELVSLSLSVDNKAEKAALVYSSFCSTLCSCNFQNVVSADVFKFLVFRSALNNNCTFAEIKRHCRTVRIFSEFIFYNFC